MRLTVDNINQHVVAAKYAVRGELAVKSEEYRAALSKGGDASKDLPFDQVISANIGNPQQLDQKPITFFRQVLSLLENPQLLEKEDVLINGLGYQPDVVQRAKTLLKSVGSVGAYSASSGVPAIKESIAKFLERKHTGLDLHAVTLTLTQYQAEMASPPTPPRSTSPPVPPPVSTPCFTSFAPLPTPASSSLSLNTLSTPPPSPSSTQHAFPTTSMSPRTGAPTSRRSAVPTKRPRPTAPMSVPLSSSTLATPPARRSLRTTSAPSSTSPTRRTSS